MSEVGSTATVEADVVVVGGGFGGLVCAVTAAAHGLRPVVLERSDQVGGAAAYSGGQVWVPGNHVAARQGIEDSVPAGAAYVEATVVEAPELRDASLTEQWLEHAHLAVRFLEDAGGIRWELIPGYPDYYHPAAPGSLAEGRYLTSAPSLLAELGDDGDRLRRSPHFPSGPTYAEMFAWGGMARRSQWDAALVEARRRAGVLVFGEGLVAQVYRAARQRSVDVRFGHRVSAVIRRDGRVAGVEAESPGGRRTFTGPVVLACSTIDWSPSLCDRYLGASPPRLGSLAPTVLTGDVVDLVTSAGGSVRALPRGLAPMLPGYRVGPSGPDDPGFRTCFEHCLPHAIVVDEQGRRFCDDSFYRDITRHVLAGSGPPRRFFLVWDEWHHQQYGLGPTPPGGTYPDRVASARSVAGLGAALGIDGHGLARTVEEFNGPARAGADPVFGRGENAAVRRLRGDPAHRPNPLVGPLEQPPFFGMELVLVGTGIGNVGALTTTHGRVVDGTGAVVEGLYAVGAAAAPVHCGASYNSGYTLSRSMTYGYLAAVDLAARHRRGASPGAPAAARSAGAAR